jgi:hypothetical protein
VKHLTPERGQSGNVRNIRFGERSGSVIRTSQANSP